MRGGYAEFFDIICKKCNTPILLYQKDGHGMLKRLYLNRIFAPSSLECLQHETFNTAREIPDLLCWRCKTMIGHPILHHEGRYAFVLVRGNFTKRKARIERWEEIK